MTLLQAGGLAVAAVMTLCGGALVFLRRVWFYRDPRRVAPDDPAAVLAPADGKVVYVREFSEGKVVCEKLGLKVEVAEIMDPDEAGDGRGSADCALDRGSVARAGWLIGIYMSPLDVHFNYAPVSGVVRRVIRTAPRVNLPMVDVWEYVRMAWLRRAVDLFGKRYHLVNERNTILIDAGDFAFAVVEIADKFVSKIRCFVSEGQAIRAGQKLSFIDRGSQVDLVLPEGAAIPTAKVGQQVYGGMSVVARMNLPAASGSLGRESAGFASRSPRG